MFFLFSCQALVDIQVGLFECQDLGSKSMADFPIELKTKYLKSSDPLFHKIICMCSTK